MPLAEWRTLFDQEVQDTASVLGVPDKDKAIGEAVKTYSKHRPRERVHELAGDGSAYEWALPSDWEDGFSAIRGEVEYPAGQRTPEYLQRRDWIVYRDPSLGLRFRLLTHTPLVTQKVRVPYIVRHTVDAAIDTVPVADRDAVAKLAASFGARQLAARYAQTSNPTLGAEVANFRTKSQEYSSLADKLAALFKQHLGLRDTDQVDAASVTADLDVDLQGGGDRVFHPRRWR